MPTDEDLPRPAADLVPTPNLDRLGIQELQQYIKALQAAIMRAEAEIGRKKTVLDAAHGFFRAPRATDLNNS